MGDYESAIKIIVCIVLGLIIFLPIIFAVLWKKKHMSSHVSEVGYILQQPKSRFWTSGIICATVSYFLLVMCISLLDNSLYFSIGAFIGFSLLGTYISIYCLLWKIVVEEDLLTVYHPFRTVRKIRFCEISEVKLKWGDIVGYVDGKRSFTIDPAIPGADILFEKFFELGKINCKSILQNVNCSGMSRKENFTVRTKKGNIIVSFISVLLVGGALILLWNERSLEAFYKIVTIVFIILMIGYIIYSLIRKVTVSFNTIYVKNILSKEKEYSLREITRVCWRRENIVIYAGERKIAKVSSEYKNFSYLLEWLLRKDDIEFFDGKGNYFTSKDYLETEKNR